MLKLLPALLLFVSPLAFAAPPSIEWMVSVLIYLVVIGLIFWLVWWALGALALPEPFNKIAHVIVILVGLVIMLYFLLGLLPPLTPHR